MEASFNYLSVLLSIVLGLAITQVLQGLRGLILPNVTEDAVVDLRDHYFAHKSWFFGAVLASLVFSVAKDLALAGHLPGRMNLKFHVLFGLTVIVAAITRREFYHKLLAPAAGLSFLLYIALLYARL